MVPHEIPRFLGSYLEGVECPPNTDAEQRGLRDARATTPMRPHMQASRPERGFAKDS
jgi:hypothetical protein